MRLIDTNKLDEEVMHLFIAITGNPKQSTVVNECKSSFRNMIEEQPTVDVPDTNVGEWIPCKEKFPEKSGMYIVSAIDGHVIRVSFAKWIPRLKTWELSGCRSYWKVIAWQPLPKPYQPEGGKS